MISDLLIIFAEALARSAENDQMAENLLERLADSPATTGDTDAILNHIKSKVLLARVQRSRGKPGAAKKQCVFRCPSMSRLSRISSGKSFSLSGSRRIRICSPTLSCAISLCRPGKRPARSWRGSAGRLGSRAANIPTRPTTAWSCNVGVA